jgi:lipid-binding SYLF domain-containing protein
MSFFPFFLGWSAPSAIGIAGLGGGFEIGAEVRGRQD